MTDFFDIVGTERKLYSVSTDKRHPLTTESEVHIQCHNCVIGIWKTVSIEGIKSVIEDHCCGNRDSCGIFAYLNDYLDGRGD